MRDVAYSASANGGRIMPRGWPGMTAPLPPSMSRPWEEGFPWKRYLQFCLFCNLRHRSTHVPMWITRSYKKGTEDPKTPFETDMITKLSGEKWKSKNSICLCSVKFFL